MSGMEPRRTIVFVCQHGAAKSVVAAAYPQRFAEGQGLNVRVVAAGTEPDATIAPGVAEALLADGIDVRGERPRRITREALASAWRIVSFGCDLSGVAPPGRAVTRWDDVPPVSEDFAAARDVIVGRLPELLDERGGDA